jgi:hypothetical protein
VQQGVQPSVHEYVRAMHAASTCRRGYYGEEKPACTSQQMELKSPEMNSYVVGGDGEGYSTGRSRTVSVVINAKTGA